MKRRYLVGLSLAAVMLVAVMWRVDWQAVVASWSTVSLSLLFVALAIKWIVIDLKSARWGVAIDAREDVDSRQRAKISRRSVRAASLIGFAGNIFLPARLGDVARVTYLSQKHGIPLATTVSSASIGPVLDLMAITLSLLLLIGTSVGSLVKPYAVITTLITLTLAWLAMSWFAKADDWHSNERSGLIGQLMTGLQFRLRGLRTGLRAIHDPRSFGILAGQTVAILVAEYLATALALRAFGLPDYWPVPLALLIALNVSFAFNLTPGNIGPHQLVCTIILGLYQVAASEAVAFSVAFQGSVHLLVVLSAAFVLFREGSNSVRPRPTTNESTRLQPEESLLP